MLLLGSKTFTIDGMTVFSDHADANQFWYLPAPVALETRADGEAQFTLIEYRPAQVAAGVKGGGFLMFTAAVPLDHAQEQRIIAQIASVFPDASAPRLSAVPFDEGSVQCVSLDLQGPGGTAQPTTTPGAFVAVEHIFGTTTPSLSGSNDAVFSLTLSQEGATILREAFENELEPIGVIYQLKYTGVRPAIDVRITADLKRVYEAFSVGLSGQAYYVSVGIDATWEKLRQTGAIQVKVINFSPASDDDKEKETWALALFKDQLLNDWFKPSLSPTTQQAVDVSTAAETAATAEAAAREAARAKAEADEKEKDKPTSEKPVTDKPESDKPATDKPDADKPATDKPDADKPATDKPATDKPATDKPATDKPATDSTAKTLVDGAKAVADKLAPQGSNPANGAMGAAPFGAALRLRYVNQDEQKVVTVEYNRQEAVQRTYAPQGYFGAFLRRVDPSKHVLQVDLDDPFFRQLAVTGTPPRDFAAIGLRSVHVAIDYGADADVAHHKHGELMFDAQAPAPQTWSVYKNPADTREFWYAVDYHFDSQADWDAEKPSYSTPKQATENADLSLDPYQFLTFAQIHVTPGRINWELVEYVEVDLDHTSASGWTAAKHFEIRADTKALAWNLRLEGRSALAYGRRLTHHLKDGNTIAGERKLSTVPAVVVDDPFFYFSVRVEPLLDAAATKQAFLDVQYADESAGYRYEANFTFSAATAGTAQQIRFPILDATERTWRYRVTIVGAANQITRGAWTETTQNEVFVTDSGGA